MSNNDYKIIGLVVGDIMDEYTIELVNDIINSIPANENIRICVLSGKFIYENDDPVCSLYYSNYNHVYDLGTECKLDGLIISVGNFEWIKNSSEMERFLNKFEGIPSVLIATDNDEKTTVNYDNYSGISEAVECLINSFGKTKICMLGGRDDNSDAVKRKNIYIDCLEKNGIKFKKKFFVETDMSTRSEIQARILLDQNPDCEAVFCVNDAVAEGLYNVMAERRLIPGKDIMVFGFDNTHRACEINPMLSSIGFDSITLGQRSLELLLAKIRGEEAVSATVPTRLYGRSSLPYNVFEYTTLDIININHSNIYRMFDDCFYRYRIDQYNRENINLRRLFYEMMSRILTASQNKYMDQDEYIEIGRLIDIFFANNCMEYTDIQKFLSSVALLQNGINKVYREGYVVSLVNRLFLRMKDNAIKSISDLRIAENATNQINRRKLIEFQIRNMDYSETVSKEERITALVKNLDKLSLTNALFYCFKDPVDVTRESVEYPEKIDLRCSVKKREVYIIHENKRSRFLKDIFNQPEMPLNKGFVTFPIIYSGKLYGYLISEITKVIEKRGEFLSNQLGIALHIIESSKG